MVRREVRRQLAVGHGSIDSYAGAGDRHLLRRATPLHPWHSFDRISRPLIQRHSERKTGMADSIQGRKTRRVFLAEVATAGLTSVLALSLAGCSSSPAAAPTSAP